MGHVDFTGLYVASYWSTECEEYQGLQVDDYELIYDPYKLGEQTVTVRYGELTDQFTITLHEEEVVFEDVAVPEEGQAFAACYDENGRMLYVGPVEQRGNGVYLTVPVAVSPEKAYCKLFVVNKQIFAPLLPSVTK